MQLKLKIRHNGGDASLGRLDLYDGVTSIQGFAQSLNIATHAYLNGEPIKKATALKGAKLYMKSAKKGSFLTEVVILMENNPSVTGAIVGYSANAFYDFAKILFRKATGLYNNEDDADTLTVKNALERQEPFFDEVAEIMEGSLQRAHRPINEGVDSISIERPRSNLILLDEETKSWVETRDEAPLSENISGNVTRYNAITRNGRVYIDQLNRIVPFRVGQDFPFNRFGVLTWSLHGSNSGQAGTQQLPKKISINARQVLSANSKVKRLILLDTFPVEDNNS
jgi:hypothetical protein